MQTALEVKKGSFIRHEGNLCRITEHDYQMGGGRAGGLVHLKLRDVKTGHVTELKMDPHDKLEDVEVERKKMKYLYTDASGFCFMDPETFEQVSLAKEAIGPLNHYMKEEMEVDVEFYDGNPVHVNLPEKVTLEVLSTAAPQKGGDNVYKEATLEGGVEILVPHFIKNGDKVVIEVETGKYLDRAKEQVRE